MRLFACACLRRIWGMPVSDHWRLFSDERCRRAVEAAEAFADGRITAEAMQEARRGAEAVASGNALRTNSAARASVATTYADAWQGAWDSAWLTAMAWRERQCDAAAAAEEEFQCHLLRDIVGDPFAPAEFDPAWHLWDGGTVKRLAQTVYDERRFADLPYLADALEDAGCADARVLEHCRSGGEHVRGCWAVDLTLGKE